MAETGFLYGGNYRSDFDEDAPLVIFCDYGIG
jgi:hypothetical protein